MSKNPGLDPAYSFCNLKSIIAAVPNTNSKYIGGAMKISLEQILKEYNEETKGRKEATSLRQRRYSCFLKTKVVQYISEGGKKREITNALDITRSTLYVWIKKFSKKKSTPFKELTVNDNFCEDKSYFTIETPSGFKIKLDSQQRLVSIIRALEGAL